MTNPSMRVAYLGVLFRVVRILNQRRNDTCCSICEREVADLSDRPGVGTSRGFRSLAFDICGQRN